MLLGTMPGRQADSAANGERSSLVATLVDRPSIMLFVAIVGHVFADASRGGPAGSMGPATSSMSSRTGRRRVVLAGGVAGGLVIAATIALVIWLGGRDAATARRALAEGRLDEASHALERWLRASPGSAEAHYLMARVAWARSDLGTFEQEWMRARSLGYPADQMMRLQGLFLARINQSGQAEPLLRRALEESRGPDPEVAEALARIYLGSFRLNEAGAILDRWTREAPGDARPYLLRTEVELRTTKDLEQASRSYREALRRDPDLDQARLGLADVLRMDHRNAEAAEEYARYMARQPEDYLGYLGAGQNALAMGDEDLAARWLDRALALAPRNPVVLGARAAAAVQARRFQDALDYIDRAVKADPFDRGNHYQRMLILTRLGNKSEANSEHQVIERLRREQEEFDRIGVALYTSPLDPELRASAAQWLMTHGHEDEAVEWANLVLASHPSHPAMNRLLADYYRKKGQVGLANHHEALAPPPAPDAVARP
jgi:tetratricopeptide (TPR) repeat protein